MKEKVLTYEQTELLIQKYPELVDQETLFYYNSSQELLLDRETFYLSITNKHKYNKHIKTTPTFTIHEMITYFTKNEVGYEYGSLYLDVQMDFENQLVPDSVQLVSDARVVESLTFSSQNSILGELYDFIIYVKNNY